MSSLSFYLLKRWMAKSFFQVLELAKASSHELSFLWNCSIHAKCCIALWDGKNYNPTVKPKSQSDIGGVIELWENSQALTSTNLVLPVR